MLKINLIILLIFLFFGCAKSNFPETFQVLSINDQSEKISLQELDKRARRYIADEWDSQIDEIENWELVNAQFREDYDAISFTYKRKIAAPSIIVLFDKQGSPNKIMGYK